MTVNEKSVQKTSAFGNDEPSMSADKDLEI